MSNNTDEQSQSLEFIEELQLTCPEHKNTIIGACVETVSLYCMRCVKQKSGTISNNTNEIVSLSEVISNFFLNQKKKDYDLAEFNNLLEAMKSINMDENRLKGLEYFNFAEEAYTQLLSKVKTCFDDEIDKLKADFKQELDEIEEKYVKLLKEPNKELISLSFPECINQSTNSDSNSQVNYRKVLKEYKDSIEVDKHSEYIRLLDFIDLIHENKSFDLQTELTNLDTFLYLSKLAEIEEIDSKFQSKLEVLESSLNVMLKELESILFPSKKECLFIVKDPNNKFESDPCDLVFSKNICESAHKSNSIDCVFTCFKSIKEEYVVVWGSPTFNVDAYDLVNKIHLFSKLAHTSTIFTTRHYLDSKLKVDMIITSSYDKSVKVWNFNDNLKLIINIPNAHTGFYIYSACLLINELDNKTYVITSAPNEHMKLWNIQGKHINDFSVANQSTYFVSTYYDHRKKKYYILNANSADVKAYSFPDLALFRTYKGTPNTWHMSAYVVDRKDKTCLVESDGTGNIRIWDFETAALISTVSSAGINLRGICIWNDQYIVSSGSDHMVKIYDIDNLKFVKNLPQHTSTVCSVMKMYVPKLGECLISHALDGKLKLWVGKNVGK